MIEKACSKQNQKILVAMSGGVDSSVVAALLVDQGYDVTGAYMINYEEETQISQIDTDSTDHKLDSSCWVPDYRDAVRVAAKLGIQLLKLDFKKEYKEQVLDHMFAEYEKGRTPNPDVMCNKFIKFGAWLEKIRELGFDKIATGHYASVTQALKHGSTEAQYELRMAKDENKDQTYFLHQLNQEQLSHTMFPLGSYTKDEVRELAKKFDLPTAKKEESMGICFVGEVSMEEFLKGKIKDKIKKGDIVTTDGKKVGEHKGLAFYTIGQRHIGVAKSSEFMVQRGENKPIYVVEKRLEDNKLVVGYEDDPLLFKSEVKIEDVHWIAGREPQFPLKCKVRMRHRQELHSVEIRKLKSIIGEPEIQIVFEKKERAVTPGQFAVFYLKGECLGGGVVK